MGIKNVLRMLSACYCAKYTPSRKGMEQSFVFFILEIVVGLAAL